MGNVTDDEKIKLINDKMDRIDENLDAHFDTIDARFKEVHDRLGAMEKRFNGMEERFDRMERLMAKTHSDVRFLSGHIMFSEQSSFMIFSITLSDDAKDTIRQEAEAGLRKLENASLDDAMIEGIKSSKRVLDKYLQPA